MSFRRLTVVCLLASACATAQQPLAAPAEQSVPAPSVEPAPAVYTVTPGTKLPLSLINSISTKRSAVGDSVYLETAFPVLAGGRIVIPVGSYVTGTVTEIKRPRRMNGLGQLYIRFDSLTLPNGVTRDFRGRVSGLDGDSKGKLDPEGKVTAESNKAGDAGRVAQTTAAGTGIGAIAGGAAGHLGMGAGIGAGVGALAGLGSVFGTRGPDVVLPAGTTMDMVVDRDLRYTDDELRTRVQ